MSRIPDILKRNLAELDKVFRMELGIIFKDAGVLMFLVALPLAYPLLYSFIYTREVVREVPVCAVDESRTALSREFLRRVDASPDCRIVARPSDMREARALLASRRAYGIIGIPSDFSSSLARGGQTHVSVFCDMSGMLYYKALLITCTNVSLDMNASIKVRRAPGTTGRQDAVTRQPLRYESVTLYNPQGGYAAFLIPAVLVLVLQQALLLGVGMAAGTMRERGVFAELASIQRRRFGLVRIAVARGAACLVLYVPAAFYVLGVVPRLFGLPHLSSWGDFSLFALPFLLAIVFFSHTVATLVRHRESVILLIVFTSVPLLFLSGVSWPATAIPGFWRCISAAFPSTFGVNAYVRLQSMGADLAAVRGEIAGLWLQAGIYFTLWLAAMRLSIRQSRRRRVRR